MPNNVSDVKLSANVTVTDSNGNSATRNSGASPEAGDIIDSGQTYNLQDVSNTVLVEVITPDVEVIDAAFFNQIDEYYDDQGGLNYDFTLDDGIFTIRG